MFQNTSPRKYPGRKFRFFFLFLFLLPASTQQPMAIAQETKSSDQILFLGKPFKYLYHQIMSDHLTLWFYVPSGDSITPGKEVISLWQFSKDVSFVDVVRSSQEAIKKGKGETLTQGGATNREYFAAFLNPCETDRCLEILLQRFWQDADGIQAVYYSHEFSGKKMETAARETAADQMGQWLAALRQLKIPQPWKSPPNPDAVLVRRYAKFYTQEGLGLAAGGVPAALKYFKEAVTLTPDDPFAYMTFGIGAAMLARKAEAIQKGVGIEGSKLAEKLWNEALRQFEARGKNEGPRSQCLYLLGDSYEHVFDDPNKAAEFYERALQLNPQHPGARRGLEKIKGKSP